MIKPCKNGYIDPSFKPKLPRFLESRYLEVFKFINTGIPAATLDGTQKAAVWLPKRTLRLKGDYSEVPIIAANIPARMTAPDITMRSWYGGAIPLSLIIETPSIEEVASIAIDATYFGPDSLWHVITFLEDRVPSISVHTSR